MFEKYEKILYAFYLSSGVWTITLNEIQIQSRATRTSKTTEVGSGARRSEHLQPTTRTRRVTFVTIGHVIIEVNFKIGKMSI